jgi:hypothetical protein
MASKHAKLQDSAHSRVLGFVQENTEMPQRELAEKVGVSVEGMHYVFNTPIDRGLVKLRKFKAAGDKPANKLCSKQ